MINVLTDGCYHKIVLCDVRTEYEHKIARNLIFEAFKIVMEKEDWNVQTFVTWVWAIRCLY
jgi:hypothetical protein